MANLRTEINKEEFMAMPRAEQSFMIFGAVKGNAENIEKHDERIAALEKGSWTKHPLSFIGGIIGGIAAKVGLG